MSKRLREWRLSRARAARAEKPAASPGPAEKFAEKAHDLDAVRKSVEDAAAVSAGFWLSYLFVLFYIGIAVGGVTHKDLLLETPVKLPFLSDVPVPLIAFFVLAPIIFIVFHAYTLLHFVMLAAKAGVYDAELRRQVSDAPDTRDAFRRQLPSNIFVQFLAGPRDIRKGLLGVLLKAVAWVTLVIGPVLLLLLIQVRFLPYHLEGLTLAHRLAILADVMLLWLLWPPVLNSRSKLMWRLERRGEGWRSRLGLTGRYIAGLTACLIPIGLAFTAATFPGERMDAWIGERQWIPPNRLTAWLGQKDHEDRPIWTSFHNLLFNTRVGHRANNSLFFTTLQLSGFDVLKAKNIDDPKKLDLLTKTLELQNRHLEHSDFSFADLEKVDFSGAYLHKASFSSANLKGANLSKAQVTDAFLTTTNLQGAKLDGAQLQGAVLDYADLQGASLNGTQLQGASLTSADLRGAAVGFLGAELQGAFLLMADIQGADFSNAHLQGAMLQGAYLAGATLINANLQGAVLVEAQLPGAWFHETQLQGASLHATDLRGVSFFRSQLDGASLLGAMLQGARFNESSLVGVTMKDADAWRTHFDDAHLSDVFEDGIDPASAITEQEFADLKSAITKDVPEVKRKGGDESIRESVLQVIEELNPDIFGPELGMPESLEAGRADETAYRKALATELERLACSGEQSAPYIVRSLAFNVEPQNAVSRLMVNVARENAKQQVKEAQARSRVGELPWMIEVFSYIPHPHIYDAGPFARRLIETILGPKCPVSAALTEQEKTELRKLAKEASAH